MTLVCSMLDEQAGQRVHVQPGRRFVGLQALRAGRAEETPGGTRRTWCITWQAQGTAAGAVLRALAPLRIADMLNKSRNHGNTRSSANVHARAPSTRHSHNHNLTHTYTHLRRGRRCRCRHLGVAGQPQVVIEGEEPQPDQLQTVTR